MTDGLFAQRVKEQKLKKGEPHVNIEGIVGLVSTIRDQANKFILKELRSCHIVDIVPAHGSILVNLFLHEELTMGDISRSIERNKSTVTVLVGKLVAMGYLEIGKDSVDNRITRVRLTGKGKALEKDFWEISQKLISRIYQGFSDMEKEILIRLLARIKNNL